MKKTFALALVLALACGLVEAGSPVAIALRQQARVSGATVTLGDVAVLSSSELASLRKLVDLPLGRAPAAGETVVVQRETLAAWIRARTGLADGALRWSGPGATQVVAAVRRVSGEAIAAAAEVALRDWLAARTRGAQVQLQSLPRDLDAPEGDLGLRPRAMDSVALRSRMLVWVEVWVDQRFIRVVAVPFQVAAGQLLPMALDALAVTGRSAAAPTVLRGQWASMRSGTGAVTLEARVEVLQDGRIGESVRVRQPGASAGVIARVTGPGQLEFAR